jgi:hypothetical protein
LIEEGSQILLVQRLTKATLHFRYQENLLGAQRSQVLLLQRLTKARLHFYYQENEPKRTQLPESKKNFFYETNPNLLGIQRSQILFVQRFTKASLHFRYQENEPKRTQLPESKKLSLRSAPKSSWYSRLTNPFCAKVYEGKAAFSLWRKRTQTNPTARIEKTFLGNEPKSS